MFQVSYAYHQFIFIHNLKKKQPFFNDSVGQVTFLTTLIFENDWVLLEKKNWFVNIFVLIVLKGSDAETRQSSREK